MWKPRNPGSADDKNFNVCNITINNSGHCFVVYDNSIKRFFIKGGIPMGFGGFGGCGGGRGGFGIIFIIIILLLFFAIGDDDTGLNL